ncbi:MAG TPA: NlpC/P60 family protein [Rhizomicrobium sp.]|nr:NlpC/P60 family protein [Rhizomicrobium sp.]
MADKRLRPARPDLAAAHLKGQVEATRFVDGNDAAVQMGRVSLRASPSDGTAQVSELLFGEIVTVYERENGWAWLQAKTDSYVGYAREDGLGQSFAADARVILPLTPLLSAPDVKSPLLDLLPLNAVVKQGKQHGNFVQVASGFVHRRALAAMNQAALDFVAVAEQFIGVPYVWGGRTFQGVDCSGLIQTALQAAALACPRDTDMMEQGLGRAIARDRLRRGDLVFWKGHMGVMRDIRTLLHANAFHMQVTSEPLDTAIARIATPITSIKRL